ncbi:transposable element Tcb2 transposase [Trichonephila clavipes]|nr:transposable element Tcb2 transposase [Trichonephila clavipes]
MDDNCRPHCANLVEDFLFEEGIVRMEWPANSPDMNPIEHVRDALGRRVADHQSPPTNSPRTGKSSSGRVGQNTTSRD